MTTTEQQNDTIILKHAPHLPGITYRKFRGEADYQAMAAITNASNQADGEDYLTTVEDLRNKYAHLERSDPGKDMIFVEYKGQAVGFGRCMWDSELNGDYLYSFKINLLPDWRRDGIPLAIAKFLQERLIEIAADHPPEAPRYFQTWGVSGADWHIQLMDRLGLLPARYGFSMVRPCSQPLEPYPLPAGIQVRPVEPADYRKVFDADAEAFQDHWGYVPPTEKDYQRWLNQTTFDPSIWKVAWEGDQVVGMVLNFIDHKENQAFNRKRGYTECISVRRPWRRKSIARALLTQSIHMFQDMNMDETALAVDTDNPSGALKLYLNLGYEEKIRFVTYRAQITD